MNVDTNGELKSALMNLKNRLSQTSIRRSDRARDQATLSEVDAALKRIEQGTYGICQTCHLVIPTGELLRRPQATDCRPCTVKQMRRERDLAA